MFNDLSALDTTRLRLILEAEGFDPRDVFDAEFSHMNGDAYVYSAESGAGERLKIYVRLLANGEVTATY